MEGVVASGMEAITSGMTTVLGFASTVLSTVLKEPVLVIPIAANFIGIGVGVIQGLRRAFS